MALAIDGSSPAIVTGNPTATTASFNPPASSILLIHWTGDSFTGANPSAPTITDNLGSHLTYTPLPWQSHADSPTVNGQAASWWASVGAGGAMTVSATNNDGSARNCGMKVWVITGQDPVTPIGANGKTGSASAGSVAQNYTASATNGQGFGGICDWDVKGAMTAGTGTTLDGSNTAGGAIEYGFFHRTTADDVNGNTNTINATLGGTSTNASWIWTEVLPAAAASIPYTSPRLPSLRDPGDSWWLQRDRRDANTVGSAPNPPASPLDSAWQAGAQYWHLYGDPALRDRRAYFTQRVLVSDPSLLAPDATLPAPVPVRTVGTRDYGEVQWLQRGGRDPLLLTAALLENELLGSVDDLRRHAWVADFYDRREVPQQRAYISPPDLLGTALVESPILGGADTAKRAATAATNADRREYPYQRPYISDPSFYPTVAPVDPLTVAWGAGGTYWQLYNVAATAVDRREVPQQRRYVSDPALLLTALLESPLLSPARQQPWTDRRQAAPGPRVFDLPQIDPTTLAAGVGGDLWRRYNVPAYADRRVTVVQPRLSDPLLLAAAVPAWGAGGGYWHLYNRAALQRVAAGWPQARMFGIPPGTAVVVALPGIVGLTTSAATATRSTSAASTRPATSTGTSSSTTIGGWP